MISLPVYNIMTFMGKSPSLLIFFHYHVIIKLSIDITANFSVPREYNYEGKIFMLCHVSLLGKTNIVFVGLHAIFNLNGMFY